MDNNKFPKGLQAFKPNDKAPDFIIAEITVTPADLQKYMEENNQHYIPPDNGDACWQVGSETFTRKEVSDMLHTQRAMISNDLKINCGNELTEKMFHLLKNPRKPQF